MNDSVMTNNQHIPVMSNEAIEYLNLSPKKTIVDATLGMGGHSQRILERILPGGALIGIDRDEESLEIARENLKSFGDACRYVHGNFMDIDSLLVTLGVEKIDGILFDLGVSSFQLGNPERGFSFQSEGPLDMRLDRKSYISAYDLINNLNEEEISTMLWNFGQERWANRIARCLIRERSKHPIATTKELSEVVLQAVPYKYRFYRIHPATRTFQAVRIAVNRELETLDRALQKAVDFLDAGGRICVISFHSLEDRIVKHTFRSMASAGLIDIITAKPLIPTQNEIDENPKCRSAKMRVAERLPKR